MLHGSVIGIMLVWLWATESYEIQLRKEAKKMGLTLSRNRDQNTYIGVVASFLLQNKTGYLIFPTWRSHKFDTGYSIFQQWRSQKSQNGNVIFQIWRQY